MNIVFDECVCVLIGTAFLLMIMVSFGFQYGIIILARARKYM